jgi:hypothetical protein
MNDDFETHVQTIAQNLSYPPTPSLRPTMPTRSPARLRWRHALALILLVALSGLLIPDIRAAIVEFLQIGVVRIYLDGVDTGGAPLNLNQVSGETALSVAQTLVKFPIRIPPQDPPDRVFVQGEAMVIFVWVADGKIERALYQTSNDDAWYMVKAADAITWTDVAGRDAAWVTLDHPVEFIRDGVAQTELTHFVTGHVLIWTRGNVTYRLETHASLDEARQFAQSLIVPE